MTRYASLPVLVLMILSAGERAVIAADPKPALLDPAALSMRIDELIRAKFDSEKSERASLCDDATFIRRVYLDLAGCIPSVSDTQDFLDDSRPDKRRLWVDELLSSNKPTNKGDAYARHFATVWRSWLLAHQSIETQIAARDLHGWLQERLSENTPYDRLVRDVFRQQAFVAAYPTPETRTGGVGRLFLGLKLECAQCHKDRGGGKWTEDDFWSMAAFYASNTPPESANARGPSIKVGTNDRVVIARFLGGSRPVWDPNQSPSATLADWITRPDNPYFAKAAVNRIWAYFMGTGFIEPLDGFNDNNPPSHPELLNLMAEQFIVHKFDLKYLIRAITASDTYQASSTPLADDKAMNPRLFARAVVRGLTAAQLYDSLTETTRLRDPMLGELTPREQTLRNNFIISFADPGERPIAATTTVPEALHLMNSTVAMERTKLSQNRGLATIVEAKVSTPRRIDDLYLLVLSRRPRSGERARMVKYVDGGGPTEDPRDAVCDVYWALINSAEFRTNH
jgi:hypothetical protein